MSPTKSIWRCIETLSFRSPRAKRNDLELLHTKFCCNCKNRATRVSGKQGPPTCLPKSNTFAHKSMCVRYLKYYVGGELENLTHLNESRELRIEGQRLVVVQTNSQIISNVRPTLICQSFAAWRQLARKFEAKWKLVDARLQCMLQWANAMRGMFVGVDVAVTDNACDTGASPTQTRGAESTNNRRRGEPTC